MLSWGLSRGDYDRRRSSGSRRDDLSLMASTRRPNAPRVRQRAASRAHPRTPATADWMRTTLPRRENHLRHAIGRIPQRLGGLAPGDAPSPWEHTRCRDLPTARQLPLLINNQLHHARAASPDAALRRAESTAHLWWSAVSKHARRSYPNVADPCEIPSGRALIANVHRPAVSGTAPRAPVRPPRTTLCAEIGSQAACSNGHATAQPAQPRFGETPPP